MGGTLTPSPFVQRVTALTRVELLLVVFCIGVLLLVLLPTIFGTKEKTKNISDGSILKHVGLAFRIFATDNSDRFPQAVSTNDGGSLEFATDAHMTFRHYTALSNELWGPKILVSAQPDPQPRIEATTFAEELEGEHSSEEFPFNSNRNISFFVGLDADETRPRSLLAGTRLITNAARPFPSEAKIVELKSNERWGIYKSELKGKYFAFGDGTVRSVANLLDLANKSNAWRFSSILSLPD